MHWTAQSDKTLSFELLLLVNEATTFRLRPSNFGSLRNLQLIEKGKAPQVGLEPTTLRLTAGCSAIELLRSNTHAAMAPA